MGTHDFNITAGTRMQICPKCCHVVRGLKYRITLLAYNSTTDAKVRVR
jgi:hypothetical protein